MPLLECSTLSRSFGGLRALSDFGLEVGSGEVVGIIGPNGAGKTTLFNLISGADRADSGRVRFRGEDVSGYGLDRRARLGLVRTFQDGRCFANLGVEDNVLLGAHGRRLASRPRSARWAIELAQALLPLAAFRDEERRLRSEAATLIESFGERLAPRSGEKAYRLSYANRRRLEIARALAARPELLLLDEPTAGMNPSETLELLEYLRGLKSRGQAMLVIEHKLPLVMKLSDRIVAMDEGEKIAEGEAEDIVRDARVIEAYLGKVHSQSGAPAREGPHGAGPA
jgi:branched-chain amino acid transport system ATP-binding protein